MGLFRQEQWSGLLCPSPGDLPNPVIKPRSPTLQTDSLPSAPWKIRNESHRSFPQGCQSSKAPIFVGSVCISAVMSGCLVVTWPTLVKGLFCSAWVPVLPYGLVGMRSLCPSWVNTFLSHAHGILSVIDHLLCHKTSFSIWKTWNPIAYTDHNNFLLEIINRKRSGESITDVWKLYNKFLNSLSQRRNPKKSHNMFLMEWKQIHSISKFTGCRYISSWEKCMALEISIGKEWSQMKISPCNWGN